MRILILGGAGMLGHQLLASFGRKHEVRATLRQHLSAYPPRAGFAAANTYSNVDVYDIDRLLEITAEFRPQAIINAVGIIKQRSQAHESIPSIEINSLLPHRLALLATNVGARLVHFSTDCVFSGRRGGYAEADVPDAEDLYGRTKLLGEVSAPGCITLRTSLIGHELRRGASLLEWFLSRQAKVRGFRRAIFSGLTTIEAARVVDLVLERYPDVYGVWHVSSEPIDKYSLLQLVKKHYGLDTEIEPDDDFYCDRSLDSTRFRAHFNYYPPSWDSMIAEMRQQGSMRQ